MKRCGMCEARGAVSLKVQVPDNKAVSWVLCSHHGYLLAGWASRLDGAKVLMGAVR